MIIGGFQKLSLIDFPGHIASIIFTKGCVFRCPYCHNPELVVYKDKSGIDEKEFWEHLKKRRGFIEGVCITGGEPTLHKDLPEFIEKIKNMGFLVKLDTNGITPEMVRGLIEKKMIDYFAMDIKHTWDKYQSIANVAKEKEPILSRVRETFDLIRNSGVSYEWRTTVLPGVHTASDFMKIAGYFRPGEKYFIQDISYIKNLDPNLDKTKKINVSELAEHLRVNFPELVIGTR